METLNEKIEKTLKDNAKVTVNDSNISIERYYKKDAESMENICDDFAINFSKYAFGQIYNLTHGNKKGMTIEELLQIFKQETGL